MYSLPPIEKDHSSTEHDVAFGSNDNYDEFTFETDTGGEEEEEEGCEQQQQQQQQGLEECAEFEDILSEKTKGFFSTLSVPDLKKRDFTFVNVIQAASPDEFWVGFVSSPS